ncbi:hypothetical protein AOLI_G00189760 [Acnodon oligacanthus]
MPKLKLGVVYKRHKQKCCDLPQNKLVTAMKHLDRDTLTTDTVVVQEKRKKALAGEKQWEGCHPCSSGELDYREDCSQQTDSKEEQVEKRCCSDVGSSLIHLPLVS